MGLKTSWFHVLLLLHDCCKEGIKHRSINFWLRCIPKLQESCLQEITGFVLPYTRANSYCSYDKKGTTPGKRDVLHTPWSSTYCPEKATRNSVNEINVSSLWYFLQKTLMVNHVFLLSFLMFLLLLISPLFLIVSVHLRWLLQRCCSCQCEVPFLCLALKASRFM